MQCSACLPGTEHFLEGTPAGLRVLACSTPSLSLRGPRSACARRAVLALQSFARMLPIRRAFLSVRRATVTIQAAERGRAARRTFIELRTRHRAALCVQVVLLRPCCAARPTLAPTAHHAPCC